MDSYTFISANVFVGDLLIGTAELLPGDVSMGGLYGLFTPNENYFAEIQPLVHRFNNDRQRDIAEWIGIDFRVQLQDGYQLQPVGGYTFEDVPELPEEPIRLEIGGVDTAVLEKYFRI
ncbi:hypothetical protein [Chitinophaga varians]|uniref:hypothetical protein n=1 Tax=Chitinophaga varians TaxID=2202339 RepID=UPI00165F6C9F|nr:hypothetical protein [Chitinophaga varians]MBC9914019.1 hypothetical protein [Chitinophaga varians]